MMQLLAVQGAIQTDTRPLLDLEPEGLPEVDENDPLFANFKDIFEKFRAVDEVRSLGVFTIDL